MEFAAELKKQHPDVLKYYSQHEVKVIWEDYSHDSAAHWLDHNGLSDASVKRVFDQYLIINHWEIYKRIV